MKSILPLLLVLFVVFVSACAQYQPTTTTTTVQVPTTTTTARQVTTTTLPPTTTTTVAAAAKIVEITSTGFSPQTLTIKSGDTVKFVNKGSGLHWPASAVHPTHAVYPGSGINKCGTAEQANIFDACKGLATNEEFSFTFNQKGTWNYHDHLNPSLTGTVVVE